MLVRLLLKLVLHKTLSVEEILSLMGEVAKLTKTNVDDGIVQKLKDVYQTDPQLFENLLKLILSLVLEKAEDGLMQEKAETQVQPKQEEKQEKQVKVEEKKEEVTVAKEDVDDLLKKLFEKK